MITKSSLLLFLFGFLVNQTASHSDQLTPEFEAQLIKLAKGSDYPQILSWHIHIAFVNKDPTRLNGSLELRNNFSNYFNLNNVKECDLALGRFGDVRLCLYEPELDAADDSPWLSGDWAAMIPLEWFTPTVTWISQNRGDYDLVIHPNTGFPSIDHLSWSLRAGKNWPLKYGKYT